MVQVIDLNHDARVEEAAALAATEAANAKDNWESVRSRVMTRVARWEHATGMLYSPGDPLLPESVGAKRGAVTPSEDHAFASYAFDSEGRIVIARESTETAWRIGYFEHSDEGWTKWTFEEHRTVVHVNAVAVDVARWIVRPAQYIVARKGVLRGAMRMFVCQEGSKLDVWTTAANWEGRIKHDEAFLDESGHPLRIVTNGQVSFERPKGDANKLLTDLRKALLREIPKRVAEAHSGHELFAICLSFGNNDERIPPAIIGYRVEDIAAAKLQPPNLWEPSAYWDLREPIHPSSQPVAKLAARLRMHQELFTPEDDRVVQMYLALARDLTLAKWPKTLRRTPGFVVYPANIEDGRWRDLLLATLDDDRRALLSEKGWLTEP